MSHPATPSARSWPPTLVVGVHLVLLDEDKVLLGLRRNTAYADGMWHLPAGHMEHGEPVGRAMAREAEEELGITVSEDDLAVVHTLHHLDPANRHSRLQLFFRPARYAGHITNREPHKCEQLFWWPLDRLPATTVPYAAQALREIVLGSTLSTLGRAA